MKDNIKVLQVAPLGAGGVTSLILNIAENLDSGIGFDYLTFYDRKEFREDLALSYGGKKYVVPIDRYNIGLVRAFFKFFYSIKAIKECNPDIIHLNISKPYDALVGLSAKLAGVKVVYIHSHTSSNEKEVGLKGSIMDICRVLIPKISTRNLACSRVAAEFMFTERVIRKGNYFIIKNSISVDKYIFNKDIREICRKKLGLSDEVIVGHVGRFTYPKNHMFLIDIFKEYYKINNNSKLLLIGTGDLEKEAKEKVVKEGLSDNVIFYGATNEVQNLMQVMDCFVLPSLYEGLPLAGVEAQASGLPLIMSDTVTKEVILTDNVKVLSLDEDAFKWANTISDVVKRKRVDTSLYVKEGGFDSKSTAKLLSLMYKEDFERLCK